MTNPNHVNRVDIFDKHAGLGSGAVTVVAISLFCTSSHRDNKAIAMTIHIISGENSGLFRPLTISNGAITLRHRIIHAPLTRNRGVPLNPISTPENPNRIWIPGNLVVDYYAQRATEGGLIISEGIPPSLEVCRKNRPRILRCSPLPNPVLWLFLSFLGYEL